VGVGVLVEVGVIVGVSVGVGVLVGVSVGRGVSVAVGVIVAVSVGVAVGSGVSVAVGVIVGVSVAVGVMVGVSVGSVVGVSVGGTVGVSVGSGVGVGVGASGTSSSIQVASTLVTSPAPVVAPATRTLRLPYCVIASACAALRVSSNVWYVSSSVRCASAAMSVVPWNSEASAVALRVPLFLRR
jgi:hypothetical protein